MALRKLFAALCGSAIIACLLSGIVFGQGTSAGNGGSISAAGNGCIAGGPVGNGTPPCAGAGTPTPTPSTTATPVPTSTPLVLTSKVLPADEVADETASVNEAMCANGTNTGPVPSPSPSSTDSPVVAYTKMSGVRHIRDGWLTCYNQSNYNTWWANLHTYEGISLIANEAAAYTTSDIQNALSTNPALEGIEVNNEWDAFTFPSGADLGSASAVGATSITTGFQYLLSDMVPNSIYCVTSTQEECFNLTGITSNVIAKISPALQYAHASGSTLIRASTWEQDDANWLAWYSPLIRYYDPTFTVYGPSMSIGTSFYDMASYPYEQYINATEDHGYPSPAGSNPEGPTGDGSMSYTGVNNGACSNNTSGDSAYGFGWNECTELYGAGVSDPEQYRTWDLTGTKQPPLKVETTEYSYDVVPIGAEYSSSFPGAIPDDTAVKYIARSYLLGALFDRTRIYWFQMADGTDGPSSGFCPFGLIRFNNCAPSDPTYPAAGDYVVKPEMLTWMTLIALLSDPGCKWPNCSFTPTAPAPLWSDPSLPLDNLNVQKSNGQEYIFAWLGEESYNYLNPSSCNATMDCYITVAPRTETVTIPYMTSATLQGFDATGTDPTPPPADYTAPDGYAEDNLVMCQQPNAVTTNYFGCATVPTNLQVTDPGTSGAYVTISVTDTPQWIMPVFNSSVASPAPSASPTTNPLPASTTPGLYPGMPTATPAPAPTATPTP